MIWRFASPRNVAQRIRAKGTLAMETVVAIPHDLRFDNVEHYSLSRERFFIRHDSTLCNTAGLSNLELWPNEEGLKTLLDETGFTNIRKMDYGQNPDTWFETDQRVMMLASRK